MKTLKKRFGITWYLALFFCTVCLGAVYLWSAKATPEGRVLVTWLCPPQYYDGTDFSEGRAWVCEREDGPWTLLDDRGNVLKRGFEAEFISSYSEGIAAFLLPNDLYCGYLNRSGDILLPSGVYDGIDGMHGEGLIIRRGKEPLYGFINLQGEWVIPPIYDNVFPFREGLAAVRKNGKYGFIDKKGTMVIDFKFDEAHWFSNRMGAVRMGSMWGVIDPDGDWIAEPVFEKFYGRYWSDPIGLQKDGKIGFVNSKGGVVIDFQYLPHSDPQVFLVGFYCFNGGYTGVILAGRGEGKEEYGVIDRSGNVVLRTGAHMPGLAWRDFIFERDSNGVPALVNMKGKRYLFPDDFKYPSIRIRNHVLTEDRNANDVFMYEDTEKHQIGYFTISTDGE